MNALGMYFAITSGEREQYWADDDERAASLARAEARALSSAAKREPVRRFGRVAGLLRQRLTGTARA